jgi:DNA invertase Pin-like site-specific DNA recombinase
LEQEFNSLDAQREACSAYIASQASLGWKAARARYDDGGLSGGSMERPALQRLLSDIKAGRIDAVVVYKIDRLTRSLMDFARIVDVFDAANVSFVSVTQQFNTTTSMGRLTLNVLLSFAQFEREVTAERIRDKIAASKKKGMWMGGPPPLGFDVEHKALVVNAAEAESVRQLFKLYLEVGGVRRLKQRADAIGLTTKRRRLRDGRMHGGKSFSRGNLYLLLSNPIYIGKVVHRGDVYPGRHQAIVDQDLWDAVQELMAHNRRTRHASTNVRSTGILTGLLFDETGDRLSPSYAIKNGVRYRYYISHRLMREARKAKDGWRLPAQEIEQPVLTVLCDHLANPLKLVQLTDLEGQPAHVHEATCLAAEHLSRRLCKVSSTEQRRLLSFFVHRIELQPLKVIVDINGVKLLSMLKDDAAPDLHFNSKAQIRRITYGHAIKRRGVEAKLVLTGAVKDDPRLDPQLIRTVAKAHLWLNELTSGTAHSIDQLAKLRGEDRNEISRFLSLAHLAPDIVEKIFEGRQPVDLTVERLRRLVPLPASWKDQRERLGFAD